MLAISLNEFPCMNPVWQVDTIHTLVQCVFNKHACLFQIRITEALYARKDIIACSPTGLRKTLTFFILIPMKKVDGKERTSIIVTPLNPLDRQVKADMKNSELTTIAVSRLSTGRSTPSGPGQPWFLTKFFKYIYIDQ